MTLPPIPKPVLNIAHVFFGQPAYDAWIEQMHAYGAACAAAERDRIRQALQDMQAACTTHNHYAHAIVATGLSRADAALVNRLSTRHTRAT